MSQSGDPDDYWITVPRDKLRLLYECALSYDRRIPEGNGGDWATPFHQLFGSVGAEAEDTPRGRNASS